jgi:hypothetical protein
MTAFLESTIFIIVLAVIVSVRLIIFLRKRAEQRGRNSSRQPRDSIEAIEAKNAAVNSTYIENGDEDFSAWDLSVEYEKAVAPLPATPARFSRFFPEISPQAILEDIPWQTSAPEILSQQALKKEPAIPVSTASNGARAAGITSGHFWEKLRTLPPLTQGVILSEVLAPPKGLTGPR